MWRLGYRSPYLLENDISRHHNKQTGAGNQQIPIDARFLRFRSIYNFERIAETPMALFAIVHRRWT